MNNTDIERDIYGNYLNDLHVLLLNTMKRIDNIPNKQWCFYRKLMNPYDFHSRRFANNRAFYKLWEILKVYPQLITNCDLYSLHLAEAPGSFVQALEKLYPDAKMKAISKPPMTYAKVLESSKSTPQFNTSIVNTIKNCSFEYIDLLNSITFPKFIYENIKDKFDFITADGGIDENTMYNNKEELHLDLILAEIKSIILLSKINGNAILKIFDVYSHKTISLLYFLSLYFTKVTIFKPYTSRPTNSEKYIICENFINVLDESQVSFIYNLSMNSNLFSIYTPIPQSFINYILDCVKYHTLIQIKTINQVIEMYLEHNNSESTKKINKKSIYNFKDKIFDEWKMNFDFQE